MSSQPPSASASVSVSTSSSPTMPPSASTATASAPKATHAPQPSSTTVRRVECPTFDVNKYANRYSGSLLVQRMRFVAERVANPAVGFAALLRASKEIKRPDSPCGLNTLAFRAISNDWAPTFASTVGASVPHELILDQAWMDATERTAINMQEKLEQGLNAARANTTKEQLRQAFVNLAQFFYKRGDITNCTKMFSRARDHCTTTAHNNEVYIGLIKAGLEIKNYPSVGLHGSKALQGINVNAPENQVLAARLKACAALVELKSKSFRQAARKLIEIGDIANWNEVISPEDIAIYASVCGLATFDRGEIKRNILENPSFRQYLALVPDVQKIVTDFYNSNYAACLSSLHALQVELQLDLYMAEHISTLTQKIRDKALIQYFTPYASVDMNMMAAAFNTPLPDLEREISKLIMDNQLQARIDSQNKVLIAQQADQRSNTFKTVLDGGDDLHHDLQALLFRMNLMRADFSVQARSHKGDKRPTGGPQGPAGMMFDPAMLGFMQP